MSLENPLENRIPTQEEISEIGKLSISIPEKIKNIDLHLRNLEEKLNKTTNKNEYDRLETMFNQLEGMKKSITEISSKATEVIQNPELKPLVYIDEETDDVLRAQLAPEQKTINPTVDESSPNIELAPEESSEPTVIPATEVKTSEPVIVSPDSNVQVQSVPVIATAPTISPTPEQPPQTPLETQAQIIAQKIKNGDTLNQEEMKFRNENWNILEKNLMKANMGSVPGTTAEQSVEDTRVPAEILGDKVQRSREEYVKALFDSRKNPGKVDATKLKSLEDEYNKNLAEGYEMIKQHTTDPRFYMDSVLDERKGYNREMRSLYAEDIRKRIDKTLTKTSTVAENVLLYSILLTGKIINDTVEFVKKGIDKVVNGSGKTIDKLKEYLAKSYKDMKASAKAPDPKANFLDQLINPLHKAWGGETGKRSFELGTKEQQAAAKKKADEEKKIADAAKKENDLEKKKTDNGAKEKTPEELEQSQMNNFLRKSFESGYEGKQMTDKEEKDAIRSWDKIKNKSVHLFMNPEKVVYKNDKGEDVSKKLSDYSKAEQGFYKKTKDTYLDRQARTPMGDGMTLEQFIKESIKNGSIK